jgi:MoaA/NifB/PqqE/SkfB family radical SAM enzyme
MYTLEDLKARYEGKEVYTCPALGGRINFNPTCVSFCHGTCVGDRVIQNGIDDTISPGLYIDSVYRHIEANQVERAHCAGCLNLVRQKFRFNGITFITICTSNYCNSKCVYCDAHEDEERSVYNPVPFLKSFIDGGLVNPNCLFDYGGGEPTINRHFEETFRFLSERKYRQRVNTNSIRFSEYVAEAVKNGLCSVRTSVDSGTRETYLAMKGVDFFDQVWDSLRKYRMAGEDVLVKYILVSRNANRKDVDGFIDRCLGCGIRNIVIDVEQVSYTAIHNRGPFFFGEEELAVARYFEEEAARRGLNAAIGAMWGIGNADKRLAIPGRLSGWALWLPATIGRIERCLAGNDLAGTGAALESLMKNLDMDADREIDTMQDLAGLFAEVGRTLEDRGETAFSGRLGKIALAIDPDCGSAHRLLYDILLRQEETKAASIGY